MTDQSSLPQEANTSLFPYRLYEMLEECEKRGKSHVVSWLPDGKAFKVHLVPEFVATILPTYFRQSKYKSYQRQLNLWGFERVTSNGPEKGAYYHKHFLKGKHSMVKLLTRQRGNKTADSPVQSPLKSTKAKHQKVKKPPTGQRHVNQLREEGMASKSLCYHDNSDKIGSQINVLVSDKGVLTSMVDIATGHDQVRQDAVDIVSLDSSDNSQRKLIFEGCEFFPLEEERYDELEEIILQAGTDILNWSRSYNEVEQSKSPSIPSNLALPPPPSQLCRV